jgi:cytidylate kinase
MQGLNPRSIGSMLASVHTEMYPRHRPSGESSAPALPFVTISRQAGAGGRTLARQLVARLNEIDPGERPWKAWDRELVERVAAEHHIPEALVDSLEHPRGWVEDFLASLSDQQYLDEFQVYRRVVVAMRALALAGRAVIVGRGGVYATSDLPSGVHLRLVAPQKDRLARIAQQRNTSEGIAKNELQRLDQEREAFHRRYWPRQALLPEIFSLTLNTSALTESQLVACVLPAISVGQSASRDVCAT